jgi:hypothetical protein
LPHFVAFCKKVGAFCIWEWGGGGLGCDSEAFMNKFTSLPFMFRVVAVVELLYALTGLVTPPSMVFSVTGWVLSPDGQWVTKLLSIALGSQAWVAWTLRDRPHAGVAAALAFYQLGSATADWVMWLTLAEQGVFSTTAAKIGVLASIPTHYIIGALLVVAIRASSRTTAVAVPALARG